MVYITAKRSIPDRIDTHSGKTLLYYKTYRASIPRARKVLNNYDNYPISTSVLHRNIEFKTKQSGGVILSLEEKCMELKDHFLKSGR